MLLEGLSAHDLCEACGLDYKTIVTEAKQSGCHPDRLLARKTGYILRFEFFYAPDPILLQPDFPMVKINGFVE